MSTVTDRPGGISAILRAIFRNSPVPLPVVVLLAPVVLLPEKILRRTAGTAGKWKRQQAAASLHWPRITDSELLWSDGHVARLTDLVQRHYLLSRTDAERQVARFFEINIG